MTGEDLANNIRKIRVLKGYSQETMAQALSISQKTYSRIENNEVSPAFEQILKIADTLNVSIGNLLSFDDRIVFNNKIENQHSGDFKVYNNTDIDFVVQLYERLILEKDEMIRTLKASNTQ